MIRLRKDSRGYQLLKLLAIGGAVTISLTSPIGAARLAKELRRYLFSSKRINKKAFVQDLKRLQERELLDWKEKEGVIELTITSQGKKAILRYKIDELQLTRLTSWDKIWRLVLFDIPHSKKKARDALREKLHDLGFYQLQKSIYISPFPCENEIEFITAFFGVREHVLLLPLQRFEGEAKLKHFLSLSDFFRFYVRAPLDSH